MQDVGSESVSKVAGAVQVEGVGTGSMAAALRHGDFDPETAADWPAGQVGSG